jgi:hypothetical protein
VIGDVRVAVVDVDVVDDDDESGDGALRVSLGNVVVEGSVVEGTVGMLVVGSPDPPSSAFVVKATSTK